MVGYSMPPLKTRNFCGKTVNKVSEYHMQVILVKNQHSGLELLLNARQWKESDEVNFIQM